MESRAAYLLAQQLMAEITQCYFQQQVTNPIFGPQPGQTRSTFNYVDAYNGYTASPPTAQDGTVLSDYLNWRQSAAVTFIDPSTFAAASASTLKQITVTVTAPSGKTFTLISLRSKYGVYEAQPGSQINYITGVSVTLQGASPAKTIYSGAHPLNISSSQ